MAEIFVKKNKIYFDRIKLALQVYKHIDLKKFPTVGSMVNSPFRVRSSSVLKFKQIPLKFSSKPAHLIKTLIKNTNL